MIIEWVLICLGIGIILCRVLRKEENGVIKITTKTIKTKKTKKSSINVEDMVLHDANNDNDIYDIGRINL